jgi:hypothetical protein
MSWKLIPNAGATEFPVLHTDPGIAPWPAATIRRRSERLYAKWLEARNGAAMPAWSALGTVMGPDLSTYCVMGEFGTSEGDPTITGMGIHFSESLDVSGDEDRTVASYPAAVLIGIILSLSSQLQHNWTPIQSAGEFFSEFNKLIRYRAAVLPFGESRARVENWLGIASWIVAPTAEETPVRH